MNHQFNLVRKQATMLLNGSAEALAQSGASPQADQVLGWRAMLDEMRFNLMVVGFFKRGKSTLINTLLGRGNDAIAPVDAEPCSNVLVTYGDLASAKEHEPFRSGAPLPDKEIAIVRFTDSGKPDQTIEVEEIRQFVTEQENRYNEKHVKEVLAFGHFPLLQDSVVMVDTPGPGGLVKAHDQIVEEATPHADAILVPFAAGSAIGYDEECLIKAISEDRRRRLIFVITKIDQLSEEELAQMRAYAKETVEKLGFKGAKIFEVAARKLLLARGSKSSAATIEKAYRESGIESLEKEIDQVFKLSSTGEFYRTRIKRSLEETKRLLQDRIDRISEEINLYKKANVEDLQRIIDQLNAEKQKIEIDGNDSIRSFNEKWRNIVKDHHHKIIKEKRTIANQLIEKIKGKGTLQQIMLTLTLPRLITTAVKQSFEKSSMELSEDLSRVSQEFVNSYCDIINGFNKRVSLLKIGDLVVFSSHSALLTTSGVSGGVLLSATAVPFYHALSTFLGQAAILKGSEGYLLWAWQGLVGTSSISIFQPLAVATLPLAANILIFIFIYRNIKPIYDDIVNNRNMDIVALKVDEAIDQSINLLKDFIEKQKISMIDEFKDKLNHKINDLKDSIELTQERLKRQDPTQLARMEESRDRLTGSLNNLKSANIDF